MIEIKNCMPYRHLELCGIALSDLPKVLCRSAISA